jgi:putative cell wall-binding protein
MAKRMRLLAILCVFAVLGPMAPAALGHAERPIEEFPSGAAGVPEYRTDGPTLVVCKPDSADRFALLPPDVRAANEALLADCEFEHIQEAVDAVTERGTRILVLPGHYFEEPSLAPPSAACAEDYKATEEADREGHLMDYDQQLACPHAQNLIAVFGDPAEGEERTCGVLCDLQIEGTGAHANDVVIDADYKKLNGVRADRADGFVIVNMTVQRTEFNAVYILDQDGFLIDQVITRWNYEYGFLTFAVDNGVYQNCEGYGNGDSTLYPGSASDIHDGQEDHDSLDPARYATVIRNCVSHHNALGYSGTAGNSVHVHDSEFAHNAIGLVTDSLFPDHPGFPQDHARWENNVFRSNNTNYYRFYEDGTCDPDKPFAARGFEHGVVCPVVPVPVGSAAMIAGGNWNLFAGNDVYDNWTYGGKQFNVPAFLRDEAQPDQFDTSHNNHWVDNRLGFGPGGTVQPNGTDFWWDDQGEGNCWEGNAAATGEVTSNGPHITQPQAGFGLPDCASGGSVAPPDQAAAPNPAKSGEIAPCAAFDPEDNPDPEGCPWFDDPVMPEGRQPEHASVDRNGGLDRIETALEISRDVHDMQGDMEGMAHTVVLARADVYADALVGAPLARRLSAPILLTHRDELDAGVLAELRRLNADRVFLLGGTAALSQGVEDSLKAAGIPDVQRVEGPNRFATSARIAKLLGGTQAYLVEGDHADAKRGWPDAVSVSGLAAAQIRPILLTTRDVLPTETSEVIDDLQVRNLSIVGGNVAVSDEQEGAIGERVPYVERLAGETRLETSAAVAERAALNVMEPTHVWMATSNDFPDALTAGASVGYLGAIMVLVDGQAEELTGPTAEWLEDRDHPTDSITLVGGVEAISAGIEASVKPQ